MSGTCGSLLTSTSLRFRQHIKERRPKLEVCLYSENFLRTPTLGEQRSNSLNLTEHSFLLAVFDSAQKIYVSPFPANSDIPLLAAPDWWAAVSAQFLQTNLSFQSAPRLNLMPSQFKRSRRVALVSIIKKQKRLCMVGETLVEKY